MNVQHLFDGVIDGIPVRTILRDGELVLCIASHALEIPLTHEGADQLGHILVKSVNRALLLGSRPPTPAAPQVAP